MMEKSHTIHYYDLFNQTQNETMFDIFSCCFDQGEAVYSFHFKGNKYAYDILEFNEDHCFGRLSRFDDYKESLTTIKTKKDEKPLNPEDYIFEKFTFFYIKFSIDSSQPSHLSAITNAGINIENCFQYFFHEKYQMLPILIFPTLSTNISDRIKNLKEIKSFECTFSDTTAANYQTRFDSIFNFGCYLKKVSIKTSFRDKKPKNIESILQDANLKYSKLKIYGKSDSGPDIIDVLKQTFTKKSKIETSSISVHNFDPIKKALNDFSDL